MKNVNFKKNSIALMVIALLPFSVSVSAQDKDSLQQHAAEFKENNSTSASSSISNKELIKEAIEQSTERDELRKNEAMSNLTQKAHEAKVKELDSERDMRIKQFVLNNVPDSILAAGEEAVNAYVMENFIQEKQDPKDHVEKVWSSTSDAVALPIPNTSWLSTPIKKSPEVVDVAPKKTEQPTPPKEEKGNAELSQTEEEALAQLGLSEDELMKMLEDGPSDAKTEVKQTPAPKSNTDELSRSNVIIDSVNVERVVIMGKSRFADMTITMKELNNGRQRTVTKEISKASPGYIFSVSGNRFELLTLNKGDVVFENLDTKKSFRKLID